MTNNTSIENDNKPTDSKSDQGRVVMCFDDALNIAKGCFDYLGGYHEPEELDIYHHGIQTVINALQAAQKRGINDSQVAVLHNIGKDT